MAERTKSGNIEPWLIREDHIWLHNDILAYINVRGFMLLQASTGQGPPIGCGNELAVPIPVSLALTMPLHEYCSYSGPSALLIWPESTYKWGVNFLISCYALLL